MESAPPAITVALLSRARGFEALRAEAEAALEAARARGDARFVHRCAVGLAAAALADPELHGEALVAALPAEHREGGLSALGPELARTLIQRASGEPAVALYAAHIERHARDLRALTELGAHLAEALPAGPVIDARLTEAFKASSPRGAEDPRLAELLARRPRALGDDGLTLVGRRHRDRVAEDLEVARQRLDLGPGGARGVRGAGHRPGRARARGPRGLAGGEPRAARGDRPRGGVLARGGLGGGRVLIRWECSMRAAGRSRRSRRSAASCATRSSRGARSSAGSPDTKRIASASWPRRTRGEPNHAEEFRALLDSAEAMRPLATVRVEPFLLAQPMGARKTIPGLVAALRKGPLRLPTEAEWEYAGARRARAHAHARWRRATRGGGAPRAEEGEAGGGRVRARRDGAPAGALRGCLRADLRGGPGRWGPLGG